MYDSPMSTSTTTEETGHPHHVKREAALFSVLAAFPITLLKLLTGLLTGSLGMLSEAAHPGVALCAPPTAAPPRAPGPPPRRPNRSLPPAPPPRPPRPAAPSPPSPPPPPPPPNPKKKSGRPPPPPRAPPPRPKPPPAAPAP